MEQNELTGLQQDVLSECVEGNGSVGYCWILLTVMEILRSHSSKRFVFGI